MSNKKPTSHNTGKAKKTVAKDVKSSQSNVDVHKKDVGLNNWWGFTNENKYTLINTHRKYFNDEGYNIYMYARNQGYSLKGSALMLALSANESGYGNDSILTAKESLHNYWGIKTKLNKKTINKQFDTQEQGEEAGPSLFENNPNTYPNLVALLKQKDPSLPALDIAMYKYDPDEHPQYPTYLHDNDMEGVVVRALQTISEDTADLRGKLDAYNPIYISDMQHTPSPFLTRQAKNDLSKVNNIKSQIDNLNHIQHELQTGEAIKTPFNLTDMPDWNRKRTNPANTNTHTGIPYSFPPADSTMRDEIPSYMPTQWKGLYNAGGNNSTQMPSATPVAHPGASQNGKNSGGVSVNFHAMATHANSSHTELNNRTHNMYAEVVAVLTAAVADSKIGIDIH